jgi:phosphatidylglycerol:prolipoprotein diacylglycerol transferase
MAIDLHAGYAAMVLLSLLLTLAFPVTKHFSSPADRRRYWTLQGITIAAALVGAKLAVLFGDALWPLQPMADWTALLVSGRSIAGALLLGFLAAEAAKPLLAYDIPPNDRFAIILPFSIGIGRIGCLLTGCCRGVPWNGPLAVTYADGIPRHPAPLYEMFFHFAMGLLLLALWRRQILFGRLFALYLVSYGAFRFVSEFWRETAKAWMGFSAYQWIAVAMVIAGGVALVARSLREPAAWAQWRAASAGAGN